MNWTFLILIYLQSLTLATVEAVVDVDAVDADAEAPVTTVTARLALRKEVHPA